MPRQLTDKLWTEVIRTILVNRPKLSDAAVARQLKATARDLNRLDAPSSRTVNRIRKELRVAPPAVREGYKFARWPDSMMEGQLPWDASQALFELFEHLRTLGRRFHCPVWLARWFWRVTSSVPDAPISIRLQLSLQLASWDAGEWPDGPGRYDPELYMSYAPWRSAEDQKAYEEAATGSGRPVNHPYLMQVAGGLDALPVVEVEREAPLGIVYNLTRLIPYIALPREEMPANPHGPSGPAAASHADHSAAQAQFRETVEDNGS